MNNKFYNWIGQTSDKFKVNDDMERFIIENKSIEDGFHVYGTIQQHSLGNLCVQIHSIIRYKIDTILIFGDHTNDYKEFKEKFVIEYNKSIQRDIDFVLGMYKSDNDPELIEFIQELITFKI